MDIDNHIRAGQDEVFVAAFECRTAKILSGQVRLLQHGAHGAIQHKNALAEGVKKSLASDLLIFHGVTFNFIGNWRPCQTFTV
jgi:hypothetical protein